MDKSTKVSQEEESNPDICQCPKCLKVQECGEVCLKCGLIFNKYYAAERMKNSDNHRGSVDVELQTSEPNDPRLLKFKKILNKGIVLYFLAAAFISIFDIGNLEFFKRYCDVVKALIPSLYGTSILSNDPNNTCLILALSWTLSIVTIGLVILWLIKQPIKESVTLIPHGNFLVRLLVFAFSMAIVADAYLVALKPKHGGKSGHIYYLVSNWAFTSAIWGLVIYSGVFFMFIILISFVVEGIDKCTSDN